MALSKSGLSSKLKTEIENVSKSLEGGSDAQLPT